jgi:hypothetical protein
MKKVELIKNLGIGNTDINAIRQAVVSKEFKLNDGNRVLVMISQYPFLIVGRIKSVVSDYVLIEAEVTNIFELDGEVFRVHIDSIEVFYIENEGIQIPDIRKGEDC